MARFSITPLGSPTYTASRLAKEFTEYLTASAQLDRTLISPASNLVADYYKDGSPSNAIKPFWQGSGLARLGLEANQPVDPNHLQVLLSGRHPRTGERIITAQGSNGRRHLKVGEPTLILGSAEPDREWFSLKDAAAKCDMTVDELERTASATAITTRRIDNIEYYSLNDLNDLIETPAATQLSAARIAELTEPLTTVEAAELTGLSRQYLSRACNPKPGAEPLLRSTKKVTNGVNVSFSIHPSDLAQFLTERQPPSTRACFDVTFTMEKSVSLLGLLAEPDVRNEVVDAMLTANAVGVDHFNFHSSNARVKGQTVATHGLSVATYVHTTSRADDPFLHVHNIVVNAVRTADDKDRALNAQTLYRQAAVASHLATAQLRYELTARFGVRWVPRSKTSVFEIQGMEPAQIAKFSQRRSEIESALRELQLLDKAETPKAADHAAVRTRPAKSNQGPDEIRARWNQQAAEVGLSPERLRDICTGAVEPSPLIVQERADLLAYLCGREGATKNHSVFNEADAAAAILRWIPDGQAHARVMPATEMASVLTDFFDLAEIVPLADPTDPAPTFTTRRCVKVQSRIEQIWESGVAAGPRIDAALVAEVLEEHASLTDEQQALVASWCLSGDRAQSAIGRPGTGKTFTCSTAVQIYQRAGYRVYGAAVKGEAARLLGTEANISSETVAMRLAQIRNGALKLTTRTVLLIDEASTISDDDLHELLSAVNASGSTLRCIGDPAQHSSVPAGGMWEHLTNRYRTNTPELTATRRMVNESDIIAAEHARQGEIQQALETLTDAGQLTVYESDTEMHASLLARWRSLRSNNNAAPLVVGDNHTRTVLNAACQKIRRDQNQVAEPLAYGDLAFGVGDEVISRRTDRKIFTAEGDYVRNGTTGVVIAVTSSHVRVDFDSIGEINLPARWVAADHLNLAYALTSYAVQGATQPVSTSVLATGAAQAELVVNITRGRRDNHLAVIRRDNSQMSHWHQNDRQDIAASVAASVRRTNTAPAIITDPTVTDRIDPATSLAALDNARSARLLTPNEHSVFSRRRLSKITQRANRNPEDILGTTNNQITFAWVKHLLRRAAASVAAYRDRHCPNRLPAAEQPYAELLGEMPDPGPRQDEYQSVVDQLDEAYDAIAHHDSADHAETFDYVPPIPDWADDLNPSREIEHVNL